jgi:hypothetical protein
MLLVGSEVGSQSRVVRFACHDCPRIGRYRPAVLAERFGDTERGGPDFNHALVSDAGLRARVVRPAVNARFAAA